jgi:hypothetical protein
LAIIDSLFGKIGLVDFLSNACKEKLPQPIELMEMQQLHHVHGIGCKNGDEGITFIDHHMANFAFSIIER